MSSTDSMSVSYTLLCNLRDKALPLVVDQYVVVRLHPGLSWLTLILQAAQQYVAAIDAVSEAHDDLQLLLIGLQVYLELAV